MKLRPSKRLIVVALSMGFLLILVALLPWIVPTVLMPMLMGNAAAPADLDTARSRLTDDGAFRISYAPVEDPIQINQIHGWTLHVETAEGQPVTDAEIRVDGGMPQHGHGLPTRPQVTQNLGQGDYLLEGVKFQMAGWWEIRLAISAGGRSDTITFNLVLR